MKKIDSAILATCLMLTVLTAGTSSQTMPFTPPSQQSFFVDGQAQVMSAQAAHAIKVEVTVIAPVKKLLPEDDQGLPHQKFLLELVNGSTILIAHDLAMANRVPIRPGDIVKIHGEYIWNSRGGLIHWTHHTDTPYHEGGWIDFQGVRYQ